jgi:branched-chain amino acid transport system substrate-binding protein
MSKFGRSFATVAMTAGTLAAAAPAQAADPIVVGAAVARSGWMVQYDEGPMNAAQLAIEEINAKGGVLGRPLTMVVSDSKTDPAGSARAASEVLAQGAQLVITSCDFDYGAPAALTANAQKVVAFGTCAADPKFDAFAIGPYAFSMATATPGLGALSAEWAYKKAGWRTAYVLLDTMLDYNKSVCGSFTEVWKGLAGEDSIIGSDTFNGADMSYPAQVSRLKNLPEQPDFVMFCSAGGGAVAMLRQLRSGGIDTEILASDSMDGDNWLESVPNLSNFQYGAYGSLFGDDPKPEVREFIEKYTAKFGAKPISSQALTGYSVIQAYAQAAERAGSLDSDAVVAELEKFNAEPLLVGPTTFTKDRHINHDRGQLIMKVENGKHKAVEWQQPTTVPNLLK